MALVSFRHECNHFTYATHFISFAVRLCTLKIVYMRNNLILTSSKCFDGFHESAIIHLDFFSQSQTHTILVCMQCVHVQFECVAVLFEPKKKEETLTCLL